MPRTHRLQLSDLEKTKMIDKAYRLWLEGEPVDHEVLLELIEVRAKEYAREWLTTSEFNSRRIEYITEHEAKRAKAQRERVAKAPRATYGLAGHAPGK